ncbi:hypothetical protein BDV93DRAFT_508724 [Ceratobasidium sp. AG-I]|nr:hypothetical protein BDV93DRAFT_508724 [Ceratobasidium sp. AG-I]
MKFSLAIVFALAGFVVAQSSSSSAAAPINTANLPACLVKCATEAAQTAGCTTSFTDPACTCKNPGFLPAIEPCIHSSCSPADHQASMQIYQSLCGTLPTGTGSSAATGHTASGSGSVTQPQATASSSSNPASSSAAGPANSSAASVVSSASATSATGSPNAALAISAFSFNAGGVWAAVLIGGAGIAQLVL